MSEQETSGALFDEVGRLQAENQRLRGAIEALARDAEELAVEHLRMSIDAGRGGGIRADAYNDGKSVGFRSMGHKLRGLLED